MRTLKVSVLAAMLAACGGSSGGGGGGEPPAVDPTTGEEVTLQDGTSVTVVAFQKWQAGLQAFQQAEQAGWNDGNCGSTRELFEEAKEEQRDQKFPEALYMAGLTAARCGDDEAARRFYNEALGRGQNPRLCEARVALGVMDLKSGNLQAAMSAFNRSVDQQAGDIRCTTGYVNRAVTRLRMGWDNKDEALRDLRRSLAVESEYLPAFNQMALLFYEWGAKGNSNAYDLAEIVCRQAQLIDANYAPIYNTWGLIKIRRGNVIEALRFFERAISLNDAMFESQMNFGEITISFRGYQDAQRAFSRAVELKSDNYEAVLGLGAAYRGLQQYDQAEAQYNRAIQIDGSRPEAYFNLGLLYQDYKSGAVDDLRKAKEYYEQFLSKVGNRRRELAETVEAVENRCRQNNNRRRRRRSDDCRPGRIQNIEITIEAMAEAEAMQAEVERMQQEAESQGQ